MPIVGHSLLAMALLSYLAATVLSLIGFQQAQSKRWLQGGLVAFTLATLATSGILCLAIFRGLYREMLALFLVGVISWLTLFARRFFRMPHLATFVAPLAVLLIFYDLFSVTPSHGATSEDWSQVLMIHIGLAILGQAFAIIACGVAILYLLQQRSLKRKELAGDLVPLDKLDRALSLNLWLGFLLLSGALLTGAMLSQFVNQSSSMGWKLWWSVLVWLWYLAALYGRNVLKISARLVAKFALGGFAILAVSFFGLTGGAHW